MTRKPEATRMRGTITMRGSVADAVEYASRLGCEVESARLDKAPAPSWMRPLQLRRPKEQRVVLLEVGASESAANRIALAHCDRFLNFVPAHSGGRS
jgi:hypothetical protein